MSNIRLKSVQYKEWQGSPKEWDVSFSLRQINLLVGQNATGKTRTLNLIWGLAALLSSTSRLDKKSGSFDFQFEKIDTGQNYQYQLDVLEGKVQKEKLFIDNEVFLEREEGKASKLNTLTDTGAYVFTQFSPPSNQLAAMVRRDEIQHPYFEVLHEWATYTRFYSFGSSLGKDSFIVNQSGGTITFDDKDANQVAGVFHNAASKYPDFLNMVMHDMKCLGYNIDHITLAKQDNVVLSGNELAGISIKEDGLDRLIDQTAMSQGMFRALSILIQVNYSQLSHRANCILIDDIGEGLDYERSTKLISILCEKASKSEFQLIMTTNDRFVMNNVELEDWVVLQRNGGHVVAYDYENSKEKFDSFRFTGLSNFSLLETDFLNQFTLENESN